MRDIEAQKLTDVQLRARRDYHSTKLLQCTEEIDYRNTKPKRIITKRRRPA